MTRRAEEIRAELLLLLVACIWASNYPLAKYGLIGLDPFLFNAIRYVTASAVVLIIAVSGSSGVRIHANDRIPLLRAGFVASVLYQIAFIVGLSLTTAGNSAILLATSPLWTIAIHARMNREAISRGMLLGMAISLSGVAMIIIGSGRRIDVAGDAMIGDIIVLLGAALWGLNTNLQKPLLIRYDAVQLTLIFVCVGAVGLSLLALPAALSTDWGSMHWSYLAAAAVSGAFSIGAANILWSNGVQTIGPGRTANFNNFVPVLAFIISYVTLDEDIGIIQFLGAGITILGIWWARR